MTALAQQVSDLTCPSCDNSLTYRDGMLHCSTCQETVPVVDGIPHFPVSVDPSDSSTFFDALSPLYESPVWFPLLYRVIGGPFAPLDDRPFLSDSLEPNQGTLLDVACGTGRFTRYIASDFDFVWGIDLSVGMLERAKQYTERDGIANVLFAQMDATDLRFNTDFFDSVACCWALHLFPDIPRTLREIHRVLAPDGRFVGVTIGEEYLLAVPGTRQVLRQTIGAHVFDSHELGDLLRDIGFRQVTIEKRGAALFFSAQNHP